VLPGSTEPLEGLRTFFQTTIFTEATLPFAYPMVTIALPLDWFQVTGSLDLNKNHCRELASKFKQRVIKLTESGMVY